MFDSVLILRKVSFMDFTGKVKRRIGDLSDSLLTCIQLVSSGSALLLTREKAREGSKEHRFLSRTIIETFEVAGTLVQLMTNDNLRITLKGQIEEVIKRDYFFLRRIASISGMRGFEKVLLFIISIHGELCESEGSFVRDGIELKEVGYVLLNYEM